MGSFMEKINIDSNNNEPPKAKEKKVAKKTEKPNGCKNFRYFVQYGRDNNEDACNDADVTLATPYSHRPNLFISCCIFVCFCDIIERRKPLKIEHFSKFPQ